MFSNAVNMFMLCISYYIYPFSSKCAHVDHTNLDRNLRDGMNLLHRKGDIRDYYYHTLSRILRITTYKLRF